MSERWPSGSGIEYLARHSQEEFEKEDKGTYFSFSEYNERFLEEDRKFYENPKMTQALSAAVRAVERVTFQQQSKSMVVDQPMLYLIEKETMSEQLKQRSLESIQNHPVGAQAPTQVQPYFPSESEWKMMLSWGTAAIKSGMLPSTIRTPEAAAIIALKGRELGIPFMIAVAHIHIINGKPTMSAEMMQALARRNLPGILINIVSSTHEKAEIEFLRPEKGARVVPISFTIEDAKRAKLLNKDVWQQYPTAMLWSRAISAGLRKVCPEALMGVSYTPEELGAEVSEDGNVIEAQSRNIDPGSKRLDVDARKPSNPQLSRLFAINKAAGNSDADLRQIIQTDYHLESTRDLNLDQYNELCDKLQSKGEEVKDEQPAFEEFETFREDMSVMK